MASCGTRAGYVAGCRGPRCTAAHRDYMRDYMRARRLGITAKDRHDALADLLAHAQLPAR